MFFFSCLMTKHLKLLKKILGKLINVQHERKLTATLVYVYDEATFYHI